MTINQSWTLSFGVLISQGIFRASLILKIFLGLTIDTFFRLLFAVCFPFAFEKRALLQDHRVLFFFSLFYFLEDIFFQMFLKFPFHIQKFCTFGTDFKHGMRKGFYFFYRTMGKYLSHRDPLNSTFFLS